MADTKPSAFTTDSTPDDADVVPFIDLDGGGAGVHLPRKLTFSDLTAYFEGRGRVTNASVTNQTPTGGTDTYLVGSDVLIPVSSAGTSRLQAKSRYRLTMMLSKTAAGTGNLVVTVRLGTAGTTADTSRAALSFNAQTAAADDGRVDLDVYFRTVGSGTSAVIRAEGWLDHRQAITGWTNNNAGFAGVTSTGFDSTVASLRIGCSINTGTSTVATITSVGAELFNLA